MECDVHMTKDGEVIVAHDADLQRLCGQNIQICDINYNEIPPMKRKFTTHFSTKEYELMQDEQGAFSTLR